MSEDQGWTDPCEKAHGNRLKARALVHQVKALDRLREQFLEDPMTKALGAPTDDFMEGWDREERGLLAKILELAADDSEDREWALERLERWMP